MENQMKVWKRPEVGVFIGRVQPPHNGHIAAIRFALSKVDVLYIILGSACQAKTVKNPWTTDERIRMVKSCLSVEERGRVRFYAAKDYMYNDNLWLASMQSALSSIQIQVDGQVKEVDIDDCNVTLFGHDKDKSTFYLHLFPHWEFCETGSFGNIDATRVREIYFHRDAKDLDQYVPKSVYDILRAEIGTPIFERLSDEFQHIEQYKDLWRGAPYPPIFVTTDAVVIKSGHVLVVRRKGELGRGLLALPGGFIRDDEKIMDSCVRELKEETQIGLPKDELFKRIIDFKVFDHPGRSLRGRTITHAYCFNLGSGDLPKVKGDDDADKAFWLPLRDVLRKEEEFFEDHFHIISYFCNRF